MSATTSAKMERERLRAAALTPIISGRGWRQNALVVGLGLIVALGVAAYVYQLINGIGVTGLSDQVFWGIYTVDLVTFIGFSYGGAMVSAILRLTHASWRGPISRIAEGTAVVTLVIGALFPIIHLGHPERVWQIMTRFQINSPITWDMVAITSYLLATLVLFALPLIPDVAMLQAEPRLGGWRQRLYRWWAAGWVGNLEQQQHLRKALTVTAIVIIPLAVMVHTVLSYAFSLTSRPGWHSTIFGPYFVVAAVYSGVALVILATVAYRRAYRLQDQIPVRSIVNLGYVMAALGVAYGYLLFTEITTEGYVGEESAELLLFSLVLDRWAVLFWLFVVTGLVVPVFLVAWARTRTVAGVSTAAALVAGALYLKRFLMFVPPLTRPVIEGEWATYMPSWVEITISLAAVAAIPLLLIGLFRVFPVLDVHEMEEIERGSDRQRIGEGAPT
jgi:molybdopterin-containing oxidoreductase family membrane subunit